MSTNQLVSSNKLSIANKEKLSVLRSIENRVGGYESIDRVVGRLGSMIKSAIILRFYNKKWQIHEMHDGLRASHWYTISEPLLDVRAVKMLEKVDINLLNKAKDTFSF